jgi:hypothetical protein
MKKHKPITLKRSEIRKSVRKPMPPPGREHEDERRKKLEEAREREAREE